MIIVVQDPDERVLGDGEEAVGFLCIPQMDFTSEEEYEPGTYELDDMHCANCGSEEIFPVKLVQRTAEEAAKGSAEEESQDGSPE